MKSHARSNLCLLQILIHGLNYLVQVGLIVHVRRCFNIEVDSIALLTVVVIVVVVLWDLVLYLVPKHQSCLVRPASSHVLDRVTSASEQNHRHSEGFHVGEQFSVAFDGEVEMPELIPG
jgi:hypothetical protein